MSISDWFAGATFFVMVLILGVRAVVLLTSMRHDIREALTFARMEALENDREHDEFRRLFDDHGKTLGVHSEEIAVLKSKSGRHNTVYEKKGQV